MAFTDNFNRANENLEASGNWTHDGAIAGALAIVSNQLRCVTTDGTGSAYKCPDQGSADHYVQFVVRSVGDSGPFACCRLADRSNFVGIRNNAGTLEVYRRVAGTLSSLHSSAQTIVSGTVLRLVCTGTNWAAYKDGVSVASGAIGAAGLTDQRQGLVGRTTSSNPWIDDFEAGPLAATVSGSMAAVETGSDTFAASGTNAGEITGTLAALEAGTDVFAGSGTTDGAQAARAHSASGWAPKTRYQLAREARKALAKKAREQALEAVESGETDLVSLLAEVRQEIAPEAQQVMSPRDLGDLFRRIEAAARRALAKKQQEDAEEDDVIAFLLVA